MSERESRLDLTQGTWVRLGTVVAVLTFMWGAYSWLDTRFTKLETGSQERFFRLESSVSSSQVRMDDAMRRIEAASVDQWTRTDQRLFILELSLRNRSIVVPPIAETRSK